jgi:hypothetical protein
MSHYRHYAVGVLFCTLLPTLAANADDSDFRFFNAFTLQEKSLEFSLGNGLLHSTQTTYDFLIGVNRGSFYLLGEMERPFSKDTNTVGPGTPSQTSIDRQDNSLTAGYNVWRSLNVFVGRKTGKTTALFVPTGISTESLEFEYREKGSFVGASYGVDFGSSGQLSFSLAYADLPTTLSRKTIRSGSMESTKGTTSGASYGIRWSGTYTEGVDYVIGYKQNNYEFDDEQKGIDNNKDMTTQQNYKTFFVGLSKVF